MKTQTLMVVPTSAIFLAIALFLGAVINAHAGHHCFVMFNSDISDMDTNNDGMVSFEDYSALHSEKLRWGFNALDSDNDGSIRANEWETFIKMHGVVKGYNNNQPTQWFANCRFPVGDLNGGGTYIIEGRRKKEVVAENQQMVECGNAGFKDHQLHNLEIQD